MELSTDYAIGLQRSKDSKIRVCGKDSNPFFLSHLNVLAFLSESLHFQQNNCFYQTQLKSQNVSYSDNIPSCFRSGKVSEKLQQNIINFQTNNDRYLMVFLIKCIVNRT